MRQRVRQDGRLKKRIREKMERMEEKTKVKVCWNKQKRNICEIDRGSMKARKGKKRCSKKLEKEIQKEGRKAAVSTYL